MKIEIHIRETNAQGNRLGKRGAFVESCRVFAEAGDGVRMNNLATVSYRYFNFLAVKFARAWRESRTAGEFLTALGIPEKNGEN